MAGDRAESAPTAAPFVPPAGYHRAQLPDIHGEDTELWVIRVPGDMDAARLDGVTLPLEALDAPPGALTTVEAGDATYDLYAAAAPQSAEHADASAQLIDMAGGDRPDVFVDGAFFEHERGLGVATDLHGIVPLVPTKQNTLHAAPKHVRRRMYLARRAPKSTAAAPVQAVPHQRHVQPWERLKGHLYVTLGLLVY